MKRYLIAAAMFMSSQIAFAADPIDLLGLDKLAVGAKPAYGKYLVKNKNGFLSGESGAIDNGSFELPVSFSGNFAITAEYKFQGKEEIRLNSDGYEIKLLNDGGYFDVYINGVKAKDSSREGYTAWAGSYNSSGTGVGKFRLTVINNELKTFDAFNQLKSTVSLKENLTYTKLAVSGIRETSELVSLNVLGDTATVGVISDPKPATTCPTPTGGAAVTLDANLNMKIPNATYQPALGNPINLWANFQFVPSADGSMTWKLSNYGVNP
jgi:hypothetical protein